MDPVPVSTRLRKFVNPAHPERRNGREGEDHEADDGGKDAEHGDVVNVVEKSPPSHVVARCVKDEGQSEVKQDDRVELCASLLTHRLQDGPYPDAQQNDDPSLVPKCTLSSFHASAYGDVDEHDEEQQDVGRVSRLELLSFGLLHGKHGQGHGLALEVHPWLKAFSH